MVAIGRAIGVEPNEKRAVLWSCALSFSVLASWYVLRPLRDAMGIVGSTRDLPRLFLGTLALTLVLSPAVSWLVSRVPRRRFLTTVYRFLGLTLVAFYAVLHGEPSVWAARAFFVWASVFNMLAVAITWGFMADVFTRAQGVRLFALIGTGGTLGAILGGLATAAWASFADPAVMLLVAALLLEGAARCALQLAEPGQKDEPCARGGTFAWLVRAGRQPFFLGVCMYLGLFTITSTALYLEQARIVKASLAGVGARTALFARMDLMVNGIALFLQLFVVGRAVRLIGVGLALAILPVLTLATFTWVRLTPVLGAIVAAQVMRRAIDYALSKPMRDVLFTVTAREDRYKTKSFIDTFVYRGGDALGAWGLEGLPAQVLGPVMLVVCAAWAWTAIFLGRKVSAKETSR
jgi:AAA family ATP:ADP antiporter